MVLGVATGLLGLGLALPTGLAFGYGYGYGVRQGYSAFKQPSKTAQGLKMSPDPVQGSLGMGLQTAEERTGVKTPIGSLGQPSIQQNGNKVLPPTHQTSGTTQIREGDTHVTNKFGVRAPISKVQKSREEWRKFTKGLPPYHKNKQYATQRRSARNI